MHGSDFVCRDIITQLGIIGGVLCVPRHIPAGNLAPDQLRIFREKKNAPFELDK
jgi:hypothetical protein